MAIRYSLFFLLLILIVTVHLSSGRRKKKQRCPKILRDNLVVRIRSAGWIAKLKCRRHFTMVEGDPNLTCVRNVWRGRIPKCITSGCEILPALANGERVYLYDNAMIRFSCSPGYSLEGSPALSCDGINWNDTMPVCVGQQTDMMSCGFEDAAVCGWTGDPKSDFQWVRSQGVTYQVGTAPKRDHTLDRPEGHFMYIDSSVRREEGQTARIYSPVFSGNLTTDGAACFSFYYHMYGHTTGSMNVYVKPEGRSLEHQAPMFQVNGFNNNYWFHEVFSINAMSDNFQIVMEVVHSSGAMADVAVDDVRLARGDECIQLRQQVEASDDAATTTTATTTTTTTTTTTSTNTTPPASPTITPTTTLPATPTTTPTNITTNITTTTSQPAILTTTPTTTTTASTSTTTSAPPTAVRTTSTSTPPATTTTTALSTTATSTVAQTEPSAAANATAGPPVTTPSTTPMSTAHTEAAVTPTRTPPVTEGTPNATATSSPATENDTTQTNEEPLPTTTPPAVVPESSPATSGTTTVQTTIAASVPQSQPSTTPVVVTTPEGTENKTLPVSESEAITSPSGPEATSEARSSTEGVKATSTPARPVTKPTTTTATATASTEKPSWPSPAPPSPTPAASTSPPPTTSQVPSPTTASLPSVSAGAKESSTSTATISLVVCVVVAVVVSVAVGVGVYVWRVRRQEKLPEDSEIRFLARDEVQMDGNIFSLGSTRPPRSTVA